MRKQRREQIKGMAAFANTVAIRFFCLGRPAIPLVFCLFNSKNQYLDSKTQKTTYILIFFIVPNRFFDVFRHKITFGVQKCTNRLCENRPSGAENSTFQNASKKIKKNYFFMMLFLSKYCILCTKGAKGHNI